jgi:hypothetical protein
MEETQHDDLSDDAREQLRAALSAVQDATFDVLISKPRRKTEFFVHLQDEHGDMKPFRMTYQAMPPKAFDDLLAAHAPTTKQQREGFQWNKDTFPSALIAAVSLTPKLTEEQAKALLEAPNWATGESDALLRNALNVQNAGLDVPFSAGG